MLNRAFWEKEFPKVVEDFARTHKNDRPVLQLVLYSGQTLLALNIIRIEDRWLQVEALDENREPAPTFIPYKNIARLSLLPKLPPKGSVGF